MYSIRKALLADRSALDQLITESTRGLSRDDYSDAQIEAMLELAVGVDARLILDETSFVAELGTRLVGRGC